MGAFHTIVKKKVGEKMFLSYLPGDKVIILHHLPLLLLISYPLTYAVNVASDSCKACIWNIFVTFFILFF